MYICEVKTKDGRKFRVAIENGSQKQRFLKKIRDNENFIQTESVLSGIHNIGDFEAIVDSIN